MSTFFDSAPVVSLVAENRRRLTLIKDADLRADAADVEAEAVDVNADATGVADLGADDAAFWSDQRRIWRQINEIPAKS